MVEGNGKREQPTMSHVEALPIASIIAGTAALALAMRPSLLGQLDAKVQGVLTPWLEGKSAYEAIKAAGKLLLGAHTLRRIWQVVFGPGIYATLLDTAIPFLKRLPAVKKQISDASDGVRKDLSTALLKDLTQPRRCIPDQGMPEGELLTLMNERHALDKRYWIEGKVTGAIYSGEAAHMDLIGKVYGMFAYYNPLHADLHPATRQMDSEVVGMTLRLFNGPEQSCGAFTTGGTESILMSMKSYRDWGAKVKGIVVPNVVACVTAHAAFDKAAQYFKFDLRKARAGADQAVDLRHLRSLIDSNTVAIVGSAPQYPTGTMDNIDALGEIATRYGIGLHVDCCLGGFLLPFIKKAGFELRHGFDFSVRGVTSISCDPHKYGFAPKGASVVMFRDPELRHCMYSFATDWTGGIYATPTILGSRPGGVVAATWASMIKHGEAGYIETTRRIVGATREIGKAIEGIEGIELVGRPDVCVVGFGASPGSGLNCYSVKDCMKEIGGWDLATLQNPAAIHLALTLPSSKNVDKFIADLRTAVLTVSADAEGKYKKGTAGIYGMAASVPPAFIAESAKVFLDTMVSQ